MRVIGGPSEALAGLWERRVLAVGAGEPLAKASQRALRRAVDQLRGQYPHTGNACTLLPAFDLVAACAPSLSAAEFPPSLDAIAVQRSLDAALDGLLFGHDEREIAFLRQHLLGAYARAFHMELEVDDAWRASPPRRPHQPDRGQRSPCRRRWPSGRRCRRPWPMPLPYTPNCARLPAASPN